MTLLIRTDRQLIRAQARSNRYVLVSFAAPAAPRREERRPVNSLGRTDPRGSTDLCSGWMNGCEQVAQFAHNVGRTTRRAVAADRQGESINKWVERALEQAAFG